jgi:hypothetical protein
VQYPARRLPDLMVVPAQRRVHDMTTHVFWAALGVLGASLLRNLPGRRSIDVELVALGILHGDSVVVEFLFL